MITISLCMIVKNEEDFLKRCLDCVCDLVDEIIVVDTGSTDNTKKIAKEYTDLIFDFPWDDDFSAARNFAFSKATKDYIYTCDADEMIDDENRQRFKDLKSVLLPEIEIVQMKYVEKEIQTVLNAKQEYRPKLYKRLRNFTWIDPVHETVRLDPVVFDSDIEILHCPASLHSKRDFSIFQKTFAINKGLSPKLFTMYAKELLKCGNEEDFTRAREIYEKILSASAITEDQLCEACCVLTRAARLQNDEAAFLKYTTKALIAAPCSEICLELGEYFLEKGDNDEAIIWFYNAAYETEPILDILSHGKAPRLGLAQCYANIAESLGYTNFAIPEQISEEDATDIATDVKDLLELHRRYLHEAMNWQLPEE